MLPVCSAANTSHKLLSDLCHVTRLPLRLSLQIDWLTMTLASLATCRLAETNAIYLLFGASLYIRYAAVSKYLPRASFNSAGFSCPGCEVKETSLPQFITIWEVGDRFWQLQGERDVRYSSTPPHPSLKTRSSLLWQQRKDLTRAGYIASAVMWKNLMTFDPLEIKLCAAGPKCSQLHACRQLIDPVLCRGQGVKRSSGRQSFVLCLSFQKHCSPTK